MTTTTIQASIELQDAPFEEITPRGQTPPATETSSGQRVFEVVPSTTISPASRLLITSLLVIANTVQVGGHVEVFPGGT